MNSSNISYNYTLHRFLSVVICSIWAMVYTLYYIILYYIYYNTVVGRWGWSTVPMLYFLKWLQLVHASCAWDYIIIIYIIIYTYRNHETTVLCISLVYTYVYLHGYTYHAKHSNWMQDVFGHVCMYVHTYIGFYQLCTIACSWPRPTWLNNPAN